MMRWTFVILARPVTFEEIVPLASVKADLDVTENDDDSIIESYRDAAIKKVENFTNRFMGTTQLRLISDSVGSVGLSLPFAPVASVEAMRVAGGAITGLRTILGEPTVVLPASGQSWPTYTSEPGAIEVDYTAGYAAGEAPSEMVAGVLLACAIFYDKPSDQKAEWEAWERVLHDSRFSGVG